MAVAVAVAVSAPGRWGTWEELLLGGAVLRHGTRDWELVASELRSRILCPCDLTPQVLSFPFCPPFLRNYVLFSLVVIIFQIFFHYIIVVMNA